MDGRRGGSTSDSSSDAGEADTAEQLVLFRKSSSLASSLSGDVGIYEDEDEDGDDDLEIEVQTEPRALSAHAHHHTSHEKHAAQSHGGSLGKSSCACSRCRMRLRSVASKAPLLHTQLGGAPFQKRRQPIGRSTHSPTPCETHSRPFGHASEGRTGPYFAALCRAMAMHACAVSASVVTIHPNPPLSSLSSSLWLLPSTHLILLTLTPHPSQELGELEELGEFFSDRALKVRLALEPHFSCPTPPPMTLASLTFFTLHACVWARRTRLSADFSGACIPAAYPASPPIPSPSLSPRIPTFPSFSLFLPSISLQQTLNPETLNCPPFANLCDTKP
jgi:hypothetical protein